MGELIPPVLVLLVGQPHLEALLIAEATCRNINLVTVGVEHHNQGLNLSYVTKIL